MSLVFNGVDQYAAIAAVPDPDNFLFVGWTARGTGDGTDETWWSIDDGSFFQQSCMRLNVIGSLAGQHQFDESTALVAPAVGTWVFWMYRHVAGTRTLRHLLDGDTDWASNVVTSGLATGLTPNALSVAAEYAFGTPNRLAPMTAGLLKGWSGAELPTDAEALLERFSIAPTVTTGLWQVLPFLEAAPGADISGNGRAVTLFGAPTYTAAKPADLTVATSVLDTAVFDDVLFDTGVAASNVAPFSDGIFDPAVFDTGAVQSLYLGAAGQAVHYRGAAAISARYLGPRVLYA